LYDVVVIGGGPVGSYVAYKIAGMGYGVVVLEQHKRVGEQICCTGIVSQECIDSFAVDGNLVLRPANSARLFSPSGKVIRLWRETNQAYILDRAAFDRAMADRAQGKGAEYRLDSLVTDLEVRDSSVTVKTTCQGERVSLETRVVVVATGLNPRFTEGLGLGKAGYFVSGAQAEVEATGVDEIEVYFGQEIAPGLFAWLVPTSPQRALVGLMAQHAPGLHMKKLILRLLAQGKIVSAEVEPVHSGILLKPLSRTHSCAEIAAEALQHGLLSDDLSARGLAVYERKWRIKLGRELEIDYHARKLYERLSDQQIDRLFDIIISHDIDKALLKARDLSFDWHSQAVLRLVGHGAISRVLGVMKIPFRPWIG
jgi:geranylgeranyl reductase family protein